MGLGRMNYADLERERWRKWRKLYEDAVDDGLDEDDAAGVAYDGSDEYAEELGCAADADADGIRDAMLHG